MMKKRLSKHQRNIKRTKRKNALTLKKQKIKKSIARNPKRRIRIVRKKKSTKGNKVRRDLKRLRKKRKIKKKRTLKLMKRAIMQINNLS